MNEYYIAQAGSNEPIGPMTIEQIRMGIDQGSISPYYLYCTRGASEWRPLLELLEGEESSYSTNTGVARIPIQAIPVKPDNNIPLAIFTTLCCCIPLGIIALIKASSVDSLWNQGKHQEAIKASESAAKYCRWGIISTIVLIVINYIINIYIIHQFKHYH